jgi:ribonucleotide reductase beta subunit family protein with ferritin-like domain
MVKRSNSEMNDEWLLKENKKRFVLFPIQHADIWEMHQMAEKTFWTAKEIDLSKDKTEWEGLTESEQHYIKHIVAFFASADGIINENLAQNFLIEVQLAEARSFYGFQIMIENVHSEVYSLLLDTFIKNTQEKETLFNALENISSIKSKGDWAMKYLDRDTASFAQRLIAFAIVEGIFFSGSFCAIFYLKNRGLMPGLCQSNELISRDEALHCKFACLLYSKLHNKVDINTIHEMIDEAVMIESEFTRESLPVELIGMNSDKMIEYIKFCADYLLNMLGYEKLYFANNPFPFMEKISLQNKANFFEIRPTAYASIAHDDITFNADF